MTSCGMRTVVSKIKKLSSGVILAWAGDQEQGLVLAHWYENGSDPDKWPAFQRNTGHDWTRLIVVEDNRWIYTYEKEPEKQLLPLANGKFMAWGSGRDYAMGAMAMRADAVKAVLIASEYDIYCGFGYEAFEAKTITLSAHVCRDR